MKASEEKYEQKAHSFGKYKNSKQLVFHDLPYNLFYLLL